MSSDFDTKMQERADRLKTRWDNRRSHRHDSRGHIWTGVFLLVIGFVALLKSFMIPFPPWLFSWQMLLIVLGLFTAVRHRFRNPTWFILVLIGGAFMVNDYFFEGELRKHLWPLILIILGAFFIFRASKTAWSRNWQEKKNAGLAEDENPFVKESFSQDDFLNTTSIFGATKKNVLSKDFKGGDIVNVFGGTELNFSQADINGRAVLEVTNIFGGSKLVVPSNWTVKSEAVTIFGGIEDKRPVPGSTDNPDKVLVLKGTVIFGGIDIKSF